MAKPRPAQAVQRPELLTGKLVRAILRGRGDGNITLLPDTHICERHPKIGYFIVRHKTARKRMVAKLKAIQQQLRHRRHEPIAQTCQWEGIKNLGMSRIP